VFGTNIIIYTKETTRKRNDPEILIVGNKGESPQNKSTVELFCYEKKFFSKVNTE